MVKLRCCNCGASNLPLFNFPIEEPLRTEWKNFAGIKDITKDSTKLCVRHFSEEDLMTERKSDKVESKRKTFIRLNKQVTPSLNRNICNSVAEIKTSRLCLLCKTREKGVVYFAFPKDIQRKNEWLRRCGHKEDFCNGEKVWYLCSRHFPESAVKSKQLSHGRNHLIKDAVPFQIEILPVTETPSIPVMKYRKIAPSEDSCDKIPSTPPLESLCCEYEIEEIDESRPRETTSTVNSSDEIPSTPSTENLYCEIEENDESRPRETTSTVNSSDEIPSTPSTENLYCEIEENDESRPRETTSTVNSSDEIPSTSSTENLYCEIEENDESRPRETTSTVNSSDEIPSTPSTENLYCEIEENDESRPRETTSTVNSSDEIPSTSSTENLYCEIEENDESRPRETTSTVNSSDGHNLPLTINELLTTHSNCPTCTAFIEHFSSSAQHNQTSPTPTTPKKDKTVKRRIRYVGDITTPDLASPKRARRSFQIAKDEVLRCRRKIDVMQKQAHRLTDRATKYKSLLDHLQDEGLVCAKAYSALSENIPMEMKQLLERQIENPSAPFPPELRKFALTLQFYSCKAYNYVRSVWQNVLPHEATLRKWYSTIVGEPGITSEALNALKIKTEKKPVACVLLVDEMSIKEYVENDRYTTYGYENLGEEMQQFSGDVSKAKSALVFLVNSLKEGWKIPIAYYLIRSMTAAERANLVRIVLQKLDSVNVHIVALAFDGTACNIQMCAALGAKFDYKEPTDACFQHPTTKEQIFIYPDPSHMIKLVRNTFGEKGPIYDSNNGVINWDFVRWLQQIEEHQGLRAGTKLTNRHIRFCDNKMNVRLAVQVLSDSVSDAMMWLKEMGEEDFQECDATAQFCANFNNIFDILNVRSRFSKKPYERIICNKEKERLTERVDRFIAYIEGLSFKRDGQHKLISSARKTGFLGLIISLKNVWRIFERINQIPGIQQEYMLTYKLLQDSLENFFSAIRSRGGFNNNPTARSFQYAYKRLLVHHEVTTNGNCALDDIQILHAANKNKNTTDAICNIKKDGTDLDIDDIIAECKIEIPPPEHLGALVEDTNKHIAGFITRRLCVKTRNFCRPCANEVESADHQNFTSRLTAQKNRKYLKNPSEDVCKVTLHAEKIFRQHRHLLHLPKLKEMLITKVHMAVVKEVFNSESMREHVSQHSLFSDHKSKLIKLISKIYIELRIHHECRQLNRKEKYIRHKNTISTTIYNNE